MYIIILKSQPLCSHSHGNRACFCKHTRICVHTRTHTHACSSTDRTRVRVHVCAHRLATRRGYTLLRDSHACYLLHFAWVHLKASSYPSYPTTLSTLHIRIYSWSGRRKGKEGQKEKEREKKPPGNHSNSHTVS